MHPIPVNVLPFQYNDHGDPSRIGPITLIGKRHQISATIHYNEDEVSTFSLYDYMLDISVVTNSGNNDYQSTQ